jgi:hypothetical protein
MGSAISYLFVHLVCIYIPSICICYIFFINYWVNFVLIFVSLCMTTYRGAKYYEYLMVGAFEKILRDCEEAERKKNDGDGEITGKEEPNPITEKPPLTENKV